MENFHKFKETVFKKDPKEGYGWKKITINLTKIKDLKLNLLNIQKNFQDYNFRLLKLEFTRKIPPKSGRCFEALNFLSKKISNFTSLYLKKSLESSNKDLKLMYLFEINISTLYEVINKLDKILEFLETLKKYNKDVEYLNKSNDHMEKEFLGYYKEFLKKTLDTSPTKFKNFLVLIQNFYKKITFYFVSDHIKEKIIGNQNHFLVQFFSKYGFVSFCNKNNLKVKNYKKINPLNIFCYRILGKNIKNTKNIFRFEQDIKVTSDLNVNQNHGTQTTIKTKINSFFRNIEKPNMKYPTIGILDGSISLNSKLKKHIKVTPISFFIDEPIADMQKTIHGEKVAAMALTGPLDSNLKIVNDNCIRPNIHLFCVYWKNINTSLFMENIEKAISSNLSIKIWNLSINSLDQNWCFLTVPSIFATFLDCVQKKYNVIIIQSAGNIWSKNKYYTILPPAEAARSLVVGAKKKDENAEVDFTSMTIINNLTKKPDLSIWAGDEEEKNYVYAGNELCNIIGTSFAAPLVARQFCHIMYKEYIQKNKEINVMAILTIKALLIQRANINLQSQKFHKYLGWGFLKNDVKNVFERKKGEIHSFFTGTLKEGRVTFLNFGIPHDNDNDKNKGKNGFSFYSTLLIEPTIDFNYGAEYIKSCITTNIFRERDDGEYASIFTSSNETEDPNNPIIGYEKNLIKNSGKWQCSFCLNKKIKQYRKISKNERYKIVLNKNERLDFADKSIDIKFVLFITLSHIEFKDYNDRFYIYNENHLDNIIEIHN